MSTHDELDAAVRAWVDELTSGHTALDWVLVVSSQDLAELDDGRNLYSIAHREGQPHHATIGLLKIGAEPNTYLPDDDDT